MWKPYQSVVRELLRFMSKQRAVRLAHALMPSSVVQPEGRCDSCKCEADNWCNDWACVHHDTYYSDEWFPFPVLN